MTHIYIASRFSNWEYLLPIRDELQRKGHVVHGRWLERAKTPLHSFDDPTVSATENIDDIQASTLLIIDTSNVETGRQRGGLYVELGYALGLGRHQVWLVGPRTNVFTYLPRIRHFSTWDKALQAL
jgi:hypothetical protein